MGAKTNGHPRFVKRNLKSSAKSIHMNEREQEKIDAELATSGEEESEKQQGETGVV